MDEQPLDVRLQALLPVVRGLGAMLGPDCEVVLHDFGRLPHSIVAIENGSVTGRKVGDGPADRMLRGLRSGAEAGDVRLYAASHEGRLLKSLAVWLRGEDGRPYGLLGLNFDLSEIERAHRALTNLAAIGRPGDEAEEDSEIFAGDIRDVVAGMVARILAELGKSPSSMSREEKMMVVERLEERGAFLVKRSSEQVAEALDLSRYTIFAYLKEIRRTTHSGGRASGGAGPEMRGDHP